MLPRWVAGTFLVAMASILAGWIGGELALDRWVIQLSLFEHVPKLPGGELTVTPLVVMTAAALALAGIGLAAFKRRDLPVP